MPRQLTQWRAFTVSSARALHLYNRGGGGWYGSVVVPCGGSNRTQASPPVGCRFRFRFGFQQVAHNWQAVIRRRVLDRKTGEHKYEDWDHAIRKFQHPTKLLAHPEDSSPSTTTLLARHQSVERHIKPTERRRRINSAKIYRRSVRRVEDLLSYIRYTRPSNNSSKGGGP
jgi:hypothetical protein